ncbi:MAG: tRNA preQ1(34) S-adenosylmethionine ribosyltransferase-isomerase QueA [Elusimicrobia bacterium]|nr:tRNA preQ1(34) S-adenosylmethionine ribosyltransferase-isomerase QueA [Elusimicrobiota bacterium]
MNNQKLSDFSYELPKNFIAQYPAQKRDESKLLVLHRNTGKIEHRIFRDITEYFLPDDVLILNKTKVIPARLSGKKQTGGRIEVLLLDKGKNRTAKAIAKPLKNLKVGQSIIFPGEPSPFKKERGEFNNKADFCEVISIDNGILELNFSDDIDLIINKHGKVPLPPYMKRDVAAEDKERYQTIFAAVGGSIAAPTAGLHFTKVIFDELNKKDVKIAEVLLHISWATFSPVRCLKIEEHKMDFEYYEVSPSAVDIINSAKRKVAVGTTSVRVLETVSPKGHPSVANGRNIAAKKGTTDIFIYPGYTFKNVDAMVTNFHLPETTLLMLVCAFAGRDLIFKAYEEAKRRNYRFASYGDAMLIL